jgi:hypothetical protein
MGKPFSRSILPKVANGLELKNSNGGSLSESTPANLR